MVIGGTGVWLVVLLVIIHHAQACSQGQCQVTERCSTNEDCGQGLYCSSCVAAGVLEPICIRNTNTDPISLKDGLPFNKYAWLTTHNSFAITSEPARFPIPRITPTNQEDNVTSQLQNGVRGLMLDMYDFQDDVWLCHSFGGNCHEFTAFRPAKETLAEIESFLATNPREIITIFIEDYVHAEKGLTKLFTDAGLMKYWFPVSKMPQPGQDWPTITEMAAQNQRLVVFTSISSKEADEGIAYQWRYTVENQYGDDGLKVGECSNRGESPALNTSLSLIVENYFPTFPVDLEACNQHSTALFDMLVACSSAAGNRWANFLAVDFYKASVGGGVFDAVDRLNRNLLSI